MSVQASILIVALNMNSFVCLDIFRPNKAAKAEDGREAMDMYRKAKESGHPFDVVIMDLTIRGGMGGKETIKKLLSYDPAAVALVSSGYFNDPIMSNCEAHGFKGVIRKPYRIEELSDALQGFLKRKS